MGKGWDEKGREARRVERRRRLRRSGRGGGNARGKKGLGE